MSARITFVWDLLALIGLGLTVAGAAHLWGPASLLVAGVLLTGTSLYGAYVWSKDGRISPSESGNASDEPV